jgi:hypothetical protein
MPLNTDLEQVKVREAGWDPVEQEAGGRGESRNEENTEDLRGSRPRASIEKPIDRQITFSHRFRGAFKIEKEN